MMAIETIHTILTDAIMTQILTGYTRAFTDLDIAMTTAGTATVGAVDAIYQLKDALDQPDPPGRVKCAHCGQWTAIQHPCEQCGAPVD